MRSFAIIMGALASVTCIGAGVWLMSTGDWQPFGLYFIGKGRDQHGEAMASEFVRRTSRWVRIEMREVRTRHGNPISRHSEATRIALDPSGRSMTSMMSGTTKTVSV